MLAEAGGDMDNLKQQLHVHKISVLEYQAFNVISFYLPNNFQIILSLSLH